MDRTNNRPGRPGKQAPLPAGHERRLHAEGSRGWDCDGMLVNGVDQWAVVRASMALEAGAAPECHSGRDVAKRVRAARADAGSRGVGSYG